MIDYILIFLLLWLIVSIFIAVFVTDGTQQMPVVFIHVFVGYYLVHLVFLANQRHYDFINGSLSETLKVRNIGNETVDLFFLNRHNFI